MRAPTGQGGAPICFTAVIVTVPGALDGAADDVDGCSAAWPVGCAPVEPASRSTACGTHGQDRFQALCDALRAARQVDDQRRRRRSRRPRATSAAIGVCARPAVRISSAKPGRLALDDVLRRLGRDVARPEPGAAGRHDQPVVHGQLAQRALDLRPLVGHDDPAADVEPGGAQERLGRVARRVVPRAVRDAVRHRDDGGATRPVDHGANPPISAGG